MAADGSRGVGGRLLVLVVERDPHIRELEAHFLELAGFAIEFASDGKAALELARKVFCPTSSSRRFSSPSSTASHSVVRSSLTP